MKYITLIIDIDECTDLNNTHACDLSGATCLNTEGSYACVCKNGFEKAVDAALTDNCTGMLTHWFNKYKTV